MLTHTFEKQRGEVIHVIRTESIKDAKAAMTSPELLESLKKILSNFQSCIAQGNGELESDAHDIKQAMDAISKAEGRA